MELSPAHEDGRSRARRDRYDAVFDAAIALFVERGYAETTMEAIARQAGVARASVFNYFPRKPAILTEWARRRRTAVHEILESQDLATCPIDVVLPVYMDAWAAVNEGMRAETVACAPAAIRETDLLTDSGLAEELAGYLRAASADGGLRRDLDAGQCGRWLAAGYFMLLLQWIGPNGTVDLQVELRRLTELFLRGMRDAPPVSR